MSEEIMRSIINYYKLLDGESRKLLGTQSGGTRLGNV